MEGEKKHFFVKLIPPRPDFADTMTEDERKIMQEHAVYWKDLMGKGICMVYGPVFDPNDTYGIGIMGVEDEAIVHNTLINDPSVKGGLNRFEIYPMRAVIK